MNLKIQYESHFSDQEQQMIDQQYTYSQIRDDLSNQFKTNFFRYIFRRHFDDYLGRSDAMKRYITVEVFGMYLFFLIGLIMIFIFYYMRYHVSPFNNHQIMGYIAFTFIMLAILITLFIFLLATHNWIRILRYKNIYGILFGLFPSNYLMHPLQYTYVIDSYRTIMPIYFSINLIETDFDQITFDNIDILSKDMMQDIMKDQFDSNERFINTMHNILIENKMKVFHEKFQHLSSYESLLKATKGTMLK